MSFALMRSLLVAPLAVAAVLGCVCFASEAHADTLVGLDLSASVPVNTPSASSGPGLALRLGQQWHPPLVRVTTEIGYGYTRLAYQTTSDWNTYRLFVGGRLGVGEV